MKRKALWLLLTFLLGVVCPIMFLWLLLHYPEVVAGFFGLGLLCGFTGLVGSTLHGWMFPKAARPRKY